MRFFFLIIIFLSFNHSLFAQKNDHSIEQKGDLKCVYKNTYSKAERQKFYPFSVSHNIKLVSFRYHARNLPVSKDVVINDSLLEVKILTKEDISLLTDILYNNFYKLNPNYGIVSQCFIPRNAILFYDKEGKLEESVIICFHCDNFSRSSEKINMGDDCSEKMKKLRVFFISKGIKIGTDLNINAYPGENTGD